MAATLDINVFHRCEEREEQLSQAIDALVASGLAFQRGAPPDADYTFEHALVREAAYGTLLRGQRQELHGNVGKTLEEQFPEIVETQPEMLAFILLKQDA